MLSPLLPKFQLNKKTILLTGLSMAIGWGIRGNFGHQYGAAFAGCLSAITVCLLSGRPDWQRKVLYFGFFGSLGWGFGATISYMQVISYTESGQVATQWFGYASLFIIGFLWASLGVAATALVAVSDKEKLTKLFKVVLYVFAAWMILDLIEDPIAGLLEPANFFDNTNSRQKNPLYWLDANYLSPCFALLAACAYDLVTGKKKNLLWIPVYIFGGALIGFLIQYILRITGLENMLSNVLTYHLGDLSYTDPTTGLPVYTSEDLLTNWPRWFADYPQVIGAFVGVTGGITLYFKRFGKFADGASLIVYMAGGWMVFFLALPVLGSLLLEHYGGIRMTPPRSDDWAGITGVFAGTIIWLRKNNYLPVAVAAIAGGVIGGLGFSGIQWLKQLLMAPGNPRILSGRGLIPGSSVYDNSVLQWANWQGQNWHSFLEQSYGFINGVAIAIGVGLLAKRLPISNEITQLPFRKWMMGICTIFVLLVIPYVNLIKNVNTWSNNLKPEVWMQKINTQQTIPANWNVPYIGKLPAMQFLSLSPEWWYNIAWLLLLIVFIALVKRHYKQPLSIIPDTWTGKAQLISMLLLWIMVLGNFERELVQWTPERLLTEGVITADAIIFSYFILALPKTVSKPALITDISFKPLYLWEWRFAILAFIVFPPLFLLTNRMIYHYSPNEVLDTRKYHLRFGPQADWRARPILKTAEHK